jgi:hypothetical protein
MNDPFLVRMLDGPTNIHKEFQTCAKPVQNTLPQHNCECGFVALVISMLLMYHWRVIRGKIPGSC